MSDVWKLTLGNVDSKGNLENASLLEVNKRQQSELASLLGSDLSQFATDDDMADPDDESIIPDKLKSNSITEDFEDEDELAEENEEEEQSHSKHLDVENVTKPLTQHEREKQEQEERFRQEQKKIFEQKRKEFELKKQQPQKQKAKRTSAFADQYILYTDPSEGDVLRFTELFGPKEYQLPGIEPYIMLKKKKQRKKKKQAKKKTDTHEEVPQKDMQYQDSIQEQEFLEKEVTVSENLKRTAEKKFQPRELDSDEEADNELSEEELDTIRTRKNQFESEMFGLYPFDQIEWEREIRWGDEEVTQDVIDKDKRASLLIEQKSAPVAERSSTINDFHMLDFDGSSALRSTSDNVSNLDNILTTPAISTNTLLNDDPLPATIDMPRKSNMWGATEEEVQANELNEEAELLAIQRLQAKEMGRNKPSTSTNETPILQPPIPPLITGSDGSDVSTIGPDGKKPRKKYTRRKKKGTEVDPLLAKTGAKSSRSRVDANISTIRNKQLQYIYNEELLGCEWLDSVMWDTESGSTKPINTNLILDFNDPDMIFEDFDEEEEKEKSEEKKKQNEKEPVNPYNLSIDAEYADASKIATGVVTTGRRHVVKHSIPACRLDKNYFRTYVKDEELRRLHRPRLKFKRNQSMPIVYRQPKKEKKIKMNKDVEKKADLSAHDHRVILVEYIEQHPPMLNNVGMATKIINYYKKKDKINEVPVPDDGEVELVDSQEEIPLLGPLKEEEFFTSIENQMYNAQIHKHQSATTDFLLTTRKTSSGVKFYIRPIPMYYTAGHIQPNLEVPAPNSRPSINFTKNRLSLFIFRKFKEQKEKGKTMRLQIDDIKAAFPTMAETSIRKRLKEVATFNRGGGDSGWWIAKKELSIPTESEMQALVTPEMVCLNESMSAGQLRLEDAGVTQLASMASFASSYARLEDRGRIRETIRFIEKETINTPWTRTTNFLNTLSGKESASLQVLSVVIHNLKPDEIVRLSKETEAAVASEAESMLPTLTDPEARRLLIESGEHEEKVRNMSRTDRKLAARKILESKNTAESSTLLSAISNKKDAKEMARNAKFRQVLQQIFQREAYKLTRGIEYYKDISEKDYMFDSMTEQEKAEHKATMDDDDDEDDEELERDFQNFMQDNKKSEQNEEDEERELQEMFKKGGILSNTQGMSDSDSDSDSETPKKNAATPKPTPPVDKGKAVETGQIPEKRYFVKKTVMIRQDDGTKKPRVEIIRDPTLVAFYKQKKEVWEKQKNKKKGKKFFGGNQNDYFQSGGKEQRRLQDMYRRFKKMYDSQLLNNKKKRRSTLAQTTYQATTAQQDKKKERAEKVKQKSARKRRLKEESKPKPKKNNNVSSEGSKIKINLKDAPPPAPATSSTVDKPGGASASGLKIQIPSSVVKEEQTKKRKAPSKSSTNPPAKKAKPSPVSTSRNSSSGMQDSLDYLSGKPQARKRRKTSIDQLAEVLSEIAQKLWSDPNSFSFQAPVPTDQYPDYKKIVSNPIDLSKIMKNIKALNYMDEKAFRNDFERMIANARLYCEGRFPNVIQQGENLRQVFEDLMKKNADRFTEIMSEGVTPSSSSTFTPQTAFNK